MKAQITPYLDLLQSLVGIPSFSTSETATAALLYAFLQRRGIAVQRSGNNIWALNRDFNPAVPTILLNSHHDTVKPNEHYTRDPFRADIIDGCLYGLGSNDAGGCVVSLIAAFLHFYEQRGMQYNLLLALTAEEEISGKNGIAALLADDTLIRALKGSELSSGIVGEPTLMQLAVAERGLLVLDVCVEGIAGHAARKEGENAIYKALEDIAWFRDYRFEKVSELLGPVQMTVTVIHTENTMHNTVPASCRFVVDVRINERYTQEEVLSTIQKAVRGTVTPRSMRMRSSTIGREHPLVQAGLAMGRSCYGSPTSSDKALLPFPALKMGPGDSARSHTADEFIPIQEIEDGINGYIRLLSQVVPGNH